MNITDNITLEELLRSSQAERYGINNFAPPYSVIVSLTKLCVNVLEPVIEHFHEPLRISSGYRCPKLNELVGGVYQSQHINGQAVDIYLDGDTEREQRYFQFIRSSIDFDQLILEGNQSTSWIHVSYVSPSLNRHKSWLQLTKTSGL